MLAFPYEYNMRAPELSFARDMSDVWKTWNWVCITEGIQSDKVVIKAGSTY